MLYNCSSVGVVNVPMSVVSKNVLMLVVIRGNKCPGISGSKKCLSISGQ